MCNVYTKEKNLLYLSLETYGCGFIAFVGMKKLICSILFLVGLGVGVFSQSIPQTMSYQAVVRDAQGTLVASKQVSVVISILKNNELGDAVYSETQSVTTNANGLMTLAIGNESNFATINWAEGPYFLKTETTVDGVVIEAVSQLMAVPYAKYAETAGNMDEYVKKSEIDAYIEAKVRSMFKDALEKASAVSDDSNTIMEEVIKDVASENTGDGKSYTNTDGDLLGTISEDNGFIYKQLSSNPDSWGSFLTMLGAYIFYDQEDLDELMKENLESDFSKWESRASSWYKGKDKLMDSLKQWTVEDYGTWAEEARKPSHLGDEAVNEILTTLLEEDWDSYQQYAYQLPDGGASVYASVSNKGINADGSVEGIFAISDSTSVKFSRGNLQYQASTNTWRFAENQFDAVAGKSNNHIGEDGGNVFVNGVKSDNINVSSTYSGWIDLFAWGTSGHQVSGEDYTAYQPYSVNENTEDYYQGTCLNGTSADWGVNSISNGSGTWRTLTNTEWNYLYQHSKEKGHFAYATIVTKKGSSTINVPGFVILPENWAGMPANCTFNAAESFGANTYTESQWFKMQQKGAAFFPASGVRKISPKSTLANKVWLTSTLTYAAYWTANASQSGSANAFWFVGSDDKGVQQQAYSKSAGQCVRLVKDLNK